MSPQTGVLEGDARAKLQSYIYFSITQTPRESPCNSPTLPQMILCLYLLWASCFFPLRPTWFSSFHLQSFWKSSLFTTWLDKLHDTLATGHRVFPEESPLLRKPCIVPSKGKMTEKGDGRERDDGKFKQLTEIWELKQIICSQKQATLTLSNSYLIHTNIFIHVSNVNVKLFENENPVNSNSS